MQSKRQKGQGKCNYISVENDKCIISDYAGTYYLLYVYNSPLTELTVWEPQAYKQTTV